MGSVFTGPERRSPRVPASIAIRFLRNGEDSKPGHSAHTVDLSDRGLRIRTLSALSPGDFIQIDSWAGNGKAMPCRVVWVRQADSGESHAGLEFQAVAEA